MEIGVIEGSRRFPREGAGPRQAESDQPLPRAIHRRVYRIRTKYGLLFFDVETEQGPGEFIMPWRGDRAERIRREGKGPARRARQTAYIIPDVELLPPADQRRFTSFIYW